MTKSRLSRIGAFTVIAILVLAGLAGCERPVPDMPTPTPEPIMSPQPPPFISDQVSPTVVSVIEDVPGAATPTIPWDLPTFTPTPEPVVDTTPATQAPAATMTPVPTATLAPPAQDGTISYTVEWGDTLYSLALRYNTTVAALVAENNLPNESLIRVGQVLRIPVGGSAGSVSTPSGATQTVYVVRTGDTLYGIAARYGTTVAAIAQANGIVNPAFIREGQRLVISTAGASGAAPSGTGRTYVVRSGDTLSAIAARFGTSAWAIAVANNLPNQNFIRAGQTLIIPGQ